MRAEGEGWETVREGTRWDTSAEPRGEAAKKSVADCGLPYAHQERTPIPLDRDAADRRTCTHQPTPLRQPNPLASVPGGSGFTPLGYKKRQSLKKGKAGKGAQGGRPTHSFADPGWEGGNADASRGAGERWVSGPMRKTEGTGWGRRPELRDCEKCQRVGLGSGQKTVADSPAGRRMARQQTGTGTAPGSSRGVRHRHTRGRRGAIGKLRGRATAALRTGP